MYNLVKGSRKLKFNSLPYERHHEKTCLCCFRPVQALTSLNNLITRARLEILEELYCLCVEKTHSPIGCAA